MQLRTMFLSNLNLISVCFYRFSILYISGRILAMCGSTKLDPRAAFIGFYATRPELHGKGLGFKAWSKVMEYAGDTNCGLCSSPLQISLYRNKAGFVHQDPHLMSYYQLSTINLSSLEQSDDLTFEVIEVSDETFQATAKYDRELIGFDRTKLLELGFKETESVTLVAIDKKSSNVIGYGAIKSSNVKQAMLGPLYADNPVIAKSLLHGLLIQCPGGYEKGIIWMALDSNQDALDLATSIGNLAPGYAPAPRLFTRSVPEPPDVKKIYAIYSPDFSAY